MKRRGSGILLHITSLPSPFGVGDLGPGAYDFVNFLAEAGQSYWQILPLTPTDPDHGNSPYHGVSAFAGNALLISPELLLEEGLLEASELNARPELPGDTASYEAAHEFKGRLLARACERFQKGGHGEAYHRFCADNAYWLDDYAIFEALRSRRPRWQWCDWPEQLRDRQPEALEDARSDLSREVEMQQFLQYIFFRQWMALKQHYSRKGIQIIGDIPIYVTFDSSDVWANQGLLKLDHEKRPYAVAGVPPDYFNTTGQLWGNPVYRWDILRENGYGWWVQRVAHNLALYDYVRIDHFRGLVAFWEVHAQEETAVNGGWKEAPALDFFHHLLRRFPCLPVIAEDLGVITPDVKEVVDRFGFPGMRLLLFASGDDMPTNPYIPHNHVRNCVAYTGTHDNNTARGWFEGDATPGERERVFRYLGREVPMEGLHWELLRLVMMSVANTAIFPMQDVLGLGEEARMNRPATAQGNWRWRVLTEQMTPALIRRLREMTELYGRA